MTITNRHELADEIAKTLKSCEGVSVMEAIGVLEMLKTDMLINYKCVIPGMPPLERHMLSQWDSISRDCDK